MSYGPFSTRELNPHVVYARDKDGSKIVEKTTFVNASVRTRELAAPASPAKFAGSGRPAPAAAPPTRASYPRPADPTTCTTRLAPSQDKYQGGKLDLPDRWKYKLWSSKREPTNAGDGYFSWNGKPDAPAL